jgi:hypothetical protein
MILGKTWLNTHGVLIDMLHDRLTFLPDRCDHDFPTSDLKESKQPHPRIVQILKRGTLVDGNGGNGTTGVSERKQDDDRGENPIALTKKARKPRKKSKKGKNQVMEEPRDESKPVSIAMIGAAAYRSLTQKKDVKTFSITLCQIDQMLESLSRQASDGPTLCAIDSATIEETKAKLPSEYHEFLDVFDRSKADELPPHRSYDHKIELEGEGQPPKSRLYPMSGYKLQKVKEYLTEHLKKGFITPSKAPYASPILFAEKKDGSLRFCVDYRKLNALTKRDRYPIPLIDEVLARV